MRSDADRSRLALHDIQDNIVLAQQFVAGTTLEAFRRDLRTLYAVVRCLEIISEAISKRLSNDVKARHPEIEWQRAADAGNVYRHAYENDRSADPLGYRAR